MLGPHAVALLASIILLLSRTTDSKACPPLGAVLPAPKHLSKSDVFTKATKLAGDVFSNLTSQIKGSAISVGVKSIHESKQLLDLHFTPEVRDKKSVDKIDGQTVYRVGSITKVFTVLAALQQAGVDMEAPVTKYLPQLKGMVESQEVNNDITTFRWDSITVGSLASHLSGLGRDSKISRTHQLLPSTNDRSGSGPGCHSGPLDKDGVARTHTGRSAKLLRAARDEGVY
jgi:CubicO group peptidase (beta-lactamase class C family)